MPDVEYILGHDAHEVRRLELQARLFEPGTGRLLRAAGLRPGARVLDIGTGAGDVAMLAAAIVGPSGRVLGVDREAGVLEHARARAEAAGLTQIHYADSPLDALDEAGFDLVVGRYVLMHQADPLALLRRATSLLRPGGTLAFLEPALAASDDLRSWSSPEVPLYTTVCGLLRTAFESVGADLSVGTGFVRLFGEAGLAEPALLHDVPMGGPGSPTAEWACLALRSLLPQLEKIGATTASGIGIDTLQERLRTELSAARSQIRIINLVGAWATIA